MATLRLVRNEQDQVCRANINAQLREECCHLASMVGLMIEEVQQDLAQKFLALDALG